MLAYSVVMICATNNTVSSCRQKKLEKVMDEEGLLDDEVSNHSAVKGCQGGFLGKPYLGHFL